MEDAIVLGCIFRKDARGLVRRAIIGNDQAKIGLGLIEE